MSDLEPNIYQHITEQSGHISIPPGSPESAMVRGRRRRNRSRVIAGFAATALVAGGATGVALAQTGTSRRSVTVATPLASASSLPAVDKTTLTWHSQPLTDGLYFESSLSSSPSAGPVYAVSTAPGRIATGNPVNVLYRSPTGAEWTELTKPAGLSADSVAADGQVVYDVGTGPAFAATGSSYGVGVAKSTNRGASWTESHLPLSFHAPTAGALTVSPQILQVASAPAGEVATVQASATLRLANILPAAAPAAKYWAATAAGAALLGAERPNACGPGETLSPGGGPPTTVAGTLVQLGQVYCFNTTGEAVRTIPPSAAYNQVALYPWAQLGVSTQAATVLAGDTLVFFSSDGTDFHQVSESLSSGYGAVLAGGPSGFALATTPSGPLPSSSSEIFTSTNGETWTALPALPVAGQVAGLGTVAGHLTVATFTSSPSGNTSTGEVFALVDGQWVAERVIGKNLVSMTASFGPLGVAVLSAVEGGQQTLGDSYVDFSADGTSWQTEDVNKAVPGSAGIFTVAVSASAVVVTLTFPGTASPAKQIALIGTPVG